MSHVMWILVDAYKGCFFSLGYKEGKGLLALYVFSVLFGRTKKKRNDMLSVEKRILCDFFEITLQMFLM